MEDGLIFATGSVGAMAWSSKRGWVNILPVGNTDCVIGPAKETEDDRVFLKKVIAEGPYRVPAVDLGLSAHAEHVIKHDDYLPWITDNCEHCRSGLLKEIDHLLAVLRR